MNKENKNNERTAIFGKVLDKQSDKLKFECVSHSGETIQVFVLNDCIAQTKELSDGMSALFLQNCEVSGTTIRVAELYKCATQGSEQIDALDMWNEFGEVLNDDEPLSLNDDEPLSLNDDEPLDMGDDNFDDSIPLSMNDDDLLTLDVGDTTKTTTATASQKAAAARELLYAAAEEVQQEMNTEIAKALVGGKRHEDFAAWNFPAQSWPTVVQITDPVSGDKSYVNYTHNGKPVNRILLNPSIRDPDADPTDISFHGAVINPRLGQTYQHLDHKDWMIPFAEAVQDIEGVKFDRYCVKNGARGAMTIDLTDMAASTRKEAAEGLTNYLNLDANFTSAILAEENGGHRCGVTMMNPLDGKGAFSAYLTIMRTYCGNLAMRGSNQTMWKIRHTAGSIAAFDIDAVAMQLRSAFMEAQKHLLAAHLLRHLPIEANIMDKMLTVFDKHNLIQQPTVSIDVDDYTKVQQAKITGEPLAKEELQSMLTIGRGQVYKSVLHGMANPDLDYVKCEEDSVDTMFHMMQSMSGTLTHAPIIVDDYKDRKTGKMKQRVLTGAKQSGVEGFMKKSAKATNLFETIASNAVSAYLTHTGESTLSADDMSGFSQYFADNPSELVIPNADGKGVGSPITEIPDYHTTWNLKVLTTDEHA